MPESHMINFRVRGEDQARIDATAKKLGLNRSDFIKRALTEAIARYAGDATPVQALPGRGKAKIEVTAARTPFDDCPKNANCHLTKLPTGVKVCESCNVKFG